MWHKFTTRDLFQIAAFRTHYKTLKKCNDVDTAFLKALCATSDDRTDEALRKDPDIIDKWAEMVGSKKGV